MPADALSIWCVYDSPTDYPGKFVARRFTLDQPTTDVVVANTLQQVRRLIPSGLYRIERQRGDDPKIVETWF